MKLTRAGVALATAGFSLFGLGVAMGNLELLLVGAFPLLLLVAGLALRRDALPPVERQLETPSPRRGDAFNAYLRIGPTPRGGIVQVHAPISAAFEIEEGTNLSLLHGAPAEPRMRLRARARGRHALAPVRAESIDPSGIAGPVARDVAPELVVHVVPRTYAVQRLRARASRRASASAMAEQDEARLGVDSTDFRELREYVWGDPPNAINWKATARRLSALGRRGGRLSQPVVNEYEKEGRRTVLVLLDGGRALRVGTTLETGLDHGVEGALATAKFFLARGARVGGWTFGCTSSAPSPPEAGSGHVASLERALSPGDPDPDASLPVALRSLHSHLAGAKALVVVVTRVTASNVDELSDGARRMRVALGRSAARAPMLVLDVRALELAPTPTAAWRAARALVERQDALAAGQLRAAGARIVPWTPGREDLRKALYRGGIE